MNTNYNNRFRQSFQRVAVAAALVFATHTLCAQSARVPVSVNGLPRPPGAIALDHLGRLPRPSPAKDESAKAAAQQVNSALEFYRELQQDSNTAVPLDVLVKAKGIVILDQWSGGAVVGASGGSALVMMKNADGRFSSPLFYRIGGASIGLRLGVSHIRTLAFVMTDKAAENLANGKTVHSNGLRMVVAANPAAKGVVTENPDLVIYQTASGLDIGALLASTSLAPDEGRNEAYYNVIGVHPESIVSGRVTPPLEARLLVAAVNNPADAYVAVVSQK